MYVCNVTCAVVKCLLFQTERKLIDNALKEASSAKRLAEEAESLLQTASNQVTDIIDRLENLQELNTTELDRLEAEFDELEAQYLLTDLTSQVKQLEAFRSAQMNLINLHVSQLISLKADVDNIQVCPLHVFVWRFIDLYTWV